MAWPMFNNQRSGQHIQEFWLNAAWMRKNRGFGKPKTTRLPLLQFAWDKKPLPRLLVGRAQRAPQRSSFEAWLKAILEPDINSVWGGNYNPFFVKNFNRRLLPESSFEGGAETSVARGRCTAGGGEHDEQAGDAFVPPQPKDVSRNLA